MIWKLDRLGRTSKGFITLSTELQSRDIGLRSITNRIDTSATADKFAFRSRAALAEMELDLVRERRIGGRTTVVSRNASRRRGIRSRLV